MQWYTVAVHRFEWSVESRRTWRREPGLSVSKHVELRRGACKHAPYELQEWCVGTHEEKRAVLGQFAWEHATSCLTVIRSLVERNPSSLSTLDQVSVS